MSERHLRWHFDMMHNGWVVQISDGWRHVTDLLSNESLSSAPNARQAKDAKYDFLLGLCDEWRYLTGERLFPIRPREGEEWIVSDIIEGEVVEERRAIGAAE